MVSRRPVNPDFTLGPFGTTALARVNPRPPRSADGQSKAFVESKIREIASRTKRTTLAGDPYDALTIWIVGSDLVRARRGAPAHAAEE